MSSDFADEPRLIAEAVERRTAPRGPIRGLMAQLPGVEAASEVIEAGLRGVFVTSDDLDRFDIGDTFAVTLSKKSMSFECRVTVVRKEYGARCGYALEVMEMTDEARAAFELMRS